MSRVRVLDCTLRDGGYCNDCHFGLANSRYLVDIIECGFLTQKKPYEEDYTRFNTLEQAARLLPQDRAGKLFVALLDYGTYDVEDLPPWDGSSLDGIRVTFHKEDRDPALEAARRIQEKGYKVFLQPMVALSYTDQEYLELIEKANQLRPYNLAEGIQVGFHSHNNLQLAYANAQTLVELGSSRPLLIDASIQGMGRGAGNLNTELFLEHLNDNAGGHYQVKPLLRAIDRVVGGFYQQSPWGYSLPNYLSASHNAHPNYALFLTEKNTLTVEDIDRIFDAMAPQKRASFDRAYIEKLYLEYMERNAGDSSLEELRQALAGKRALVVAPGKSAKEEREKIAAFAGKGDVASIGVNFDDPYLATDYIFLSNLRRQEELGPGREHRLIATSNLPDRGAKYRVDYRRLLNHLEPVWDNAGLMLVKLLIQLGVKELYLAGVDGYSHDPGENYAQDALRLAAKSQTLDAMNQGMCQVLGQFAQQATIRFLTKPRYVRLPGA